MNDHLPATSPQASEHIRRPLMYSIKVPDLYEMKRYENTLIPKVNWLIAKEGMNSNLATLRKQLRE